MSETPTYQTATQPQKIYEVYCIKHAYKEWESLNHSIKAQFLKKLQKLIIEPRIDKNHLRGDLSNCYKIKLKRAGYRLVYQVIDEKVILLIWSVDKRENSDVYDEAVRRVEKYKDLAIENASNSTKDLTKIDIEDNN